MPTADRQRATVQVKVTILDRDPRILPEMGARVDFLEDTARAATRPRHSRPPLRVPVPAAAVRSRAAKRGVARARRPKLESRAGRRPGPVSGGFREIRSGLTGGEQIVVGGVESRDGDEGESTE